MKKFVKILMAILAVILLISIGKYGYNEYKIIEAEKRAEEARLSVACVGDSLTFRRSYDGWPIYNYPAILSDLLGDAYKVKNYGVSGTCVQTDLSNPFSNTRAYRASVEADADIVVIMLGSNDIWDPGWRDEETFYRHYTAFIDTYLQTEKNPQIYLCTIPYLFIGENPETSIHNEIAEKITSVIRKVAEERGYPIIEMRQVTMGHPEWYDEDGVHFNKEGANGIAETVAQAIRKKVAENRWSLCYNVCIIKNTC